MWVEDVDNYLPGLRLPVAYAPSSAHHTMSAQGTVLSALNGVSRNRDPGISRLSKKGLLRHRARVSPEDSLILWAESHLGFLLPSSAKGGESQETEGLGYLRNHTEA